MKACTMEMAAAVARGARVFINEGAGTAFKNRNAGRSQIELLGMCDCVHHPPLIQTPLPHFTPAGDTENCTTGQMQRSPDWRNQGFFFFYSSLFQSIFEST